MEKKYFECELRDHAAPSAGSLATAFDDTTAAPEWSFYYQYLKSMWQKLK
jgi:hypothetical protein